MTIDQVIADLINAKEHGLEGNTPLKTEVTINVGDESIQVNGEVEYIDFNEKFVYINTSV
jgi:hypothetical protein